MSISSLLSYSFCLRWKSYVVMCVASLVVSVFQKFPHTMPQTTLITFSFMFNLATLSYCTPTYNTTGFSIGPLWGMSPLSDPRVFARALCQSNIDDAQMSKSSKTDFGRHAEPRNMFYWVRFVSAWSRNVPSPQRIRNDVPDSLLP